MAKYRQHLFSAQHFPRPFFSELKSSQKDYFNWKVFFRRPATFSSTVKQIRQSLHQMVTSLVGLLIACSDIFFLLAHILRVLYQILESVLSFVLAACKLIWLIVMCSLVTIVYVWGVLFFDPGLVSKVFELCFRILRALCLFILVLIFVAIAMDAKNANHVKKTDQKFHRSFHAQ